MPTNSDRLAIITGTSSGIGAALAQELLTRGWRVVGISRRSVELANPNYRHVIADLRDLEALPKTIDFVLGAEVSSTELGRVALINNAADIGLLGQVAQIDPAALLGVYAVNVAAPLALTGWLLQRANSATAVRIVDVSTGAAVNPYPGCGAYGSSKAALRLAGMILATELDAAEAGGAPARDVAMLSYEPGVVDTEMQLALRNSTSEILPMIGFFTEAKATGMLVPAAAPAREIADWVAGESTVRFAERRLGGS